MVSAAHVLRISMVVLIVPTAFALAGIHGDFEQHLGSHADFSLLGLVVLLAVGTATALIATRLRIPNGWVLGPLLTTAFFTGAGVTLSSMPKPLGWGAQLLMGWSMGSKFTRRFFMVKPWFLLTVAVYTAGALALSAGMALAMANLTDRHNASAVLGFVPGGVAEMALTAAALHLEVPLVTTLHLIRVVTAALLVGLIFQVWIEPRLRTKVQHQ
jgi:membrane AbrB-like protein